MNLLLKLKPLEAHLDAFDKTKSMTDVNAVRQCITIWDEWKNIPEVSLVIYGKHKETPKTDMSCGSCVAEAISSLVAWRNAQRQAIPKISFKGVPDMSKPKAKVSEEVVTFESSIETTLGKLITEDDVKAQLKIRGIKYHHKMKLPALLGLLNK